jgi:hypothetical protein
MLILAFDFSLRSPGICVCEVTSTSKTYHLFGVYGGLGTETSVSDTLTVRLIKLKNVDIENKSDTTVLHDLVRYNTLISTLLEYCVLPFLQSHALDTIHVVVESYAFISKKSGSNYKLHEVTGILKYELFKLGIRQFTNLSSSSWRSLVFGTTHVTKNHALAYFQNHSCVSSTAFDLMSFCKRKLGKHDFVPTPVQDLCEALCLCDAYTQSLCSVPPASNTVLKRTKSFSRASNKKKLKKKI